ncbi:hypothetical protein UlMin_025851 [Ulmus minor]
MNFDRCAACKYSRRKCHSNCIFYPYFPFNNPQRFACVHRIYGSSNVGKILQKLPVHLRAKAVDCMYIEAKCRIEDPVYGSVQIISQLHHQIFMTKMELAKTIAQIALGNNFSRVQETQIPRDNDHMLETSEANFNFFEVEQINNTSNLNFK